MAAQSDLFDGAFQPAPRPGATVSRRRLLPYVDGHRCGRWAELADGDDPAVLDEQLRTDGALAVGELVPTRKACTAWYKAWEQAERAARGAAL